MSNDRETGELEAALAVIHTTARQFFYDCECPSFPCKCVEEYEDAKDRIRELFASRAPAVTMEDVKMLHFFMDVLGGLDIEEESEDAVSLCGAGDFLRDLATRREASLSAPRTTEEGK